MKRFDNRLDAQALARRAHGTIQAYRQRLEAGENMKVAIRRSQFELEQLENDCERRRQQIGARRHARANPPTLLNT